MSFPAYEEYKDSGVEWLGEVPVHWPVLPCRAIVNERTDRNDDGECEDYLSLMANVGVIPYADKGDIGNKKPEDLTKCKMVHKGDFVINSMNYYIGSYGVSRYHGVCSPVYIVLTTKHDVMDARYAFRIFEIGGFQEYAQSFGNGILEHRRSINWDILKTIPVPLPPLPEQRTIAAFLDAETSKIDGLVSEQRRLIELLKEKRQAVISHAVTKGLNPDVKMKPSGIEWLGEVPEGWEVRRFSHAIDFQEGPGIMANDFHDNGIPLVRISGVKSRWVTLEGCKYLDPSLVAERWKHFRLREGDLVISASASMGTVSEVAAEAIGAVPYTGLIRLVPASGLTVKEFIRSLVVSDVFMKQIDLLKAGATIQHFGPTHLRQIKIPLPPPNEQQKIAVFVDSQLLKFDTLIAQAERAIELLQERRTALISAAVTGKIDVRGYKPEEAVA